MWAGGEKTSHFSNMNKSKWSKTNLFAYRQGRRPNLKEVPQNFTEAFNVGNVTTNDVIRKNQHRKEKKLTWALW